LADYFIARGDRLPTIRATLTNADGTPVNLTGATVTFTMKDVLDVPKVNAAACSPVDAVNGVVEYALQAADVNTPGDYFGRFTASFGGLSTTVPNDSFLWVVVS
jgi:hypothetical protein